MLGIHFLRIGRQEFEDPSRIDLDQHILDLKQEDKVELLDLIFDSSSSGILVKEGNMVQILGRRTRNLRCPEPLFPSSQSDSCVRPGF